MISLLRFYLPGKGARLGCRLDETVYDVTALDGSLASWLKASVGRIPQAIADLTAHAAQAPTSLRIPFSQLDEASAAGMASKLARGGEAYLLPPVDYQEVWAAGVTYERSRLARQAEAVDGGDVYARAYAAGRPEVFYKAASRHVVGPYDHVGIRSDSAWSVPEPELAVVLNPQLQVVGFTVGNDMSSRDIEGANPLYLPQAKIYTASCALGPEIVLLPSREWPDATISMEVRRGGSVEFRGEVHTQRIRRSIPDLLSYLGRCYTFPEGVVLLSGTGIVPPDDFKLEPDDLIDILIDGIGRLINPVKVV
jgi:2-dehydro-3-deoxy-D-arabinonate dehydratase